MTEEAKEFIRKSDTKVYISRDRFLSVVIWDDNTAQITIDSCGISQTMHLSPGDVQIFIDALHGGSHA